MHNDFNNLRNIAMANRDKAIEAAHATYAETLKRIAELELDLIGRTPGTDHSIAACIDSVIPGNRTFTTPDILTALEAKFPARSWRRRAIDERISKLRLRGVVRRVRRSRQNMPAVYARDGVPAERNPFDDMQLAEAMAHVLGDRTLTAVELTVAMLEAGYPTSMNRSTLAAAVRSMAKREKTRFKRVGEKWRVA